jgi:hypothetical protein
VAWVLSSTACNKDTFYHHFEEGSLVFHDANGNGAWESGEDLVVDRNDNGVFD